MSAFRDFEQAAARLEAAERAFQQAQARIQPFSQQSAEELNRVLAEFAQGGLLPGIDISLHGMSHLEPNHHCVAADRIDIKGGDVGAGDDVRKDHHGSQIAEEIAKAARAQEIPVIHETNFGHNIQVSAHIKEREKCPGILLSALAAYAETKGNTDLARLAREAGERMNALVSSFKDVTL